MLELAVWVFAFIGAIITVAFILALIWVRINGGCKPLDEDEHGGI